MFSNKPTASKKYIYILLTLESMKYNLIQVVCKTLNNNINVWQM
jgi:hypothetical protein